MGIIFEEGSKICLWMKKGTHCVWTHGFVILYLKFDHVQELVVEEAAKHEVVGSLLLAGHIGKQTAIVPIWEKLEICLILEWPCLIALSQLGCFWLLQCVLHIPLVWKWMNRPSVFLNWIERIYDPNDKRYNLVEGVLWGAGIFSM